MGTTEDTNKSQTTPIVRVVSRTELIRNPKFYKDDIFRTPEPELPKPERVLSDNPRQIRRRAKRAALKAARLYSDNPDRTALTQHTPDLSKDYTFQDNYHRHPALYELCPEVIGTRTAQDALKAGGSPDLVIAQLKQNTTLSHKYIKDFVKKHTPSLPREINTQGEW